MESLKRWLVLLAFSFTALGFCAQTGAGRPLKTSDIPRVVLQKFSEDFPGVPGTWRKMNEDYRVDFTDNISRKAQAITYDRDGNIMKRDNEVQSVPADSGQKAEPAAPKPPSKSLKE